jgi:hypothetical protein
LQTKKSVDELKSDPGPQTTVAPPVPLMNSQGPPQSKESAPTSKQLPPPPPPSQSLAGVNFKTLDTLMADLGNMIDTNAPFNRSNSASATNRTPSSARSKNQVRQFCHLYF